MSIASRLQDAIATVCPVIGVSIGNPNDKATWRIDYGAGATPQQQAAALAAVAAFDPAAADPNDLRLAAVKANARRQALVTAIQNSDDTQLIAYVTNAVTDLPSARTMLVNLALLVAGVIRN